jgi:hypothetical protein
MPYPVWSTNVTSAELVLDRLGAVRRQAGSPTARPRARRRQGPQFRRGVRNRLIAAPYKTSSLVFRGLGSVACTRSEVSTFVELRGLEPLTPTLPGAGSCSNQARLATNGRVGGVAGAATVVVVVVVVKTVVRSGANSATLNASSYRAICADDRMRQGWRSKRLSGGLCRRTASGEVSSRLRGTAGVDNLRPPEPRPEESEDGRHDE